MDNVHKKFACKLGCYVLLQNHLDKDTSKMVIDPSMN